jgi:hypothetical protein
VSFQFVETSAGFRTNGQHRRVFQKRSRNQPARFVLDERQHLFLNEIFFRNDDQTVAYTKQTADIEVLACLRHHAFVSSNNEREQIDPMRTGEHVFDEAFMAGNVNEPDPEIAELEIRETEIDRNAATLFFGKAIRICPCESAYERAFPVIYVAGRANDE